MLPNLGALNPHAPVDAQLPSELAHAIARDTQNSYGALRVGRAGALG
jgi:hypothetical protein